MKILRAFGLAAAAFAAVSCASTSDLHQAQDQVAELQEGFANVKRTASSKEEVQGVNARIAEQTEMLLKSNATLVSKVDEMDDRIQNTQGSVEQTTYRLDQLAQQLAETQAQVQELRARLGSAGGEATGEVTVPAPSVPAGDPTHIYQAAYRDYQRGNFDLAIDGFREFLTAAPASDLADNAAYWIGESLFSQKKYREAIQQFDDVVTRFPKSDKVPGSLLKKGYSYISIGENAQGVVQLQYVLHEHPRSHEAGLAKQKLAQLGIETK